MKNNRHIRTGHVHQAVAYALVLVGGLVAVIIVMKAEIAAVMLEEQAAALEANVSASGASR